MKRIISNYLKATMLVGDITNESAQYYQSDCMTVQKFNYTIDRLLDSRGLPFGHTNVTTLTTTVRVMNKVQVKMIFEMLEKVNCNDFSFLFNATFAPDGMISDKDDAMLVRGVVVDIKENFNSVAKNGNQQMLLTLKILIADITYLGSMSNKILAISKL